LTLVDVSPILALVDMEADMTRTTALPPSLSFALAQERVAELRARAEHAQLVRTARGRRRSPAWPAGVAAALRDSIASSVPSRGARRRGEPCPTC
jgi:hypothetical protein